MIEKFTVTDADLFTFYKIPKELFTNPKYESVSTEGKVLYGLLLDRNSLSIKNGWIDEQGYVYIYFSREAAMELLKISSATIVKLFKELKNVDLIEEVRQGLNKPNIIYVGKFITSNTEAPMDFQNLKVRTFKNQKSEALKNKSQDIQNLKRSHTEVNNTYISKTDISQSVCLGAGEDVKVSRQMTDRQTEKKASQIKSQEKPHLPVCEVTEADIKHQIGYSSLATLGDTSLLDEVVLNMFDMYHSSGVKIKDDVKPQAIVHSVLSKVTYWHIVYILDRFKQVTTTIKNKKSYLQTMIYNSVLEQQAHYTNEVQVDMLAWAEELQHKQDQTTKPSLKGNFEQRPDLTDEEYEKYYANLT